LSGLVMYNEFDMRHLYRVIRNP